MKRPDTSEHEPYYGRYINLVPEGEVPEILEEQGRETIALLKGLTEDHGNYRYAPGKWSLKDLVGHVIDTERVFVFRALVFSRSDTQPFPGMEQDDYARAANYAARPLGEIIGEFESVRTATIHLFRSFTPEILLRSGIANGCRFTVRSIMYIVAGHELHHLRILREKYLQPG